ncbi:ZrgA family zinc uptake protein, partial [Vibrio sagamiensis]|uniref:ZrgA family zinc uptake protein n=2 Tax=Vibrio sagamiensis TaxID=512650 RepID=UPI00058661AD
MPSKHILALTIGLSFSAATVHAEEYRQHEAHVHGHAEFNIAQDGHDLLIEVKSPGADIVGFEHAPQDAQQEKALTLAVNKLKDATSLFTINPQADCTLEEARVSHTLNKHHEEHNDAKHGHEDHDHEEHHDKGHEGHDHEEHHDKGH